jgi:hypothetical protein
MSAVRASRLVTHSQQGTTRRKAFVFPKENVQSDIVGVRTMVIPERCVGCVPNLSATARSGTTGGGAGISQRTAAVQNKPPGTNRNRTHGPRPRPRPQLTL